MKFKLILLFTLITNIAFSQIVINEFDCDSPGFDDKEFIELKSSTPNFALDGYVLVFFNGSASGADKSYYTIDLDGGITDSNGLFVIASDKLNPFPQMLISESVFQNGADAVGLYTGSFFDFPEGTLATQNNLIDAMVYGTGDLDDTGLLALLGETIQYNDNGTTANPKSIQRYVDGMGTESFVAATPTPRQENDDTEPLKAIQITTIANQFNEGDDFDITFSLFGAQPADFNFTFTLDNGAFDTSDYTGATNLTIVAGQTSISTTISLIDDVINEGDEELSIEFGTLADPIIAYNNFIKVRVVDNDFVVAPYGTPLNPTFGLVTGTQPNGYYDSLNGLQGAALEQAIQDIIANPSVVRAQTYNDVIDILEDADKNPENSNEVWLVYKEIGRPILDYQTGSTSTGKWNREHTFPRSLAGYFSIEADETRDGKDFFWTTKADSLRHGNSDAHALRAADGPENSSRGNQHYGQYSGPTGTAGSFKGDVARSVLYLQLRYNGLSIENGFPSVDGQMGDLATLLDWHRNDPPDDFEMNRNNVVYTWQINRNPLIDMPDLVEYIWGNQVGTGTAWMNTLGTTNFIDEEFKVYPNPATDKLYFKGLNRNFKVSIFSTEGREVLSKTDVNTNNYIDLRLTAGLYLVKIQTEDSVVIKKIQVR